MIKSWADCSSDEDTDDNYSVESEEQAKEQTLDAAFSEKVQVDGQGPNEAGGPEQQPPQVRTYDFPDRAPFTAFVGNLSYDIQESSQLQQALADVVFERLGQRINVLGGRISFDRNSENRQHRGFGYVELETLEELKMVMKLNDDGQALLAGRNVQVDTANHQNRSNNKFNQRGQQGSNNNNRHDNPRGSFNRFNDARPQNNEPFEKIDGSKFRGGKFNNNDKNSNNNNSFRNNNTSSNNNNNNSNNGFRNNNNNNASNNNNSFRSSSFQKGPDSGDAPRQRPSLKLAPRSKPVDGEKNATSSNIFGGAKARDEQTWKKSRQQQQQDQPASGGDETKKTTTVSSKKGGEDNNSNNNNNKTVGKDKKTESQDRRQSGRGGGRGGKGRGNNQRGGSNNSGRGDQKDKRGSGKKQHDKKQDKKQQQLISPEEKAAAAAAKTNNKTTDAPPSNPEPKAPKAPKNRFALLNDSDSD